MAHTGECFTMKTSNASPSCARYGRNRLSRGARGEAAGADRVMDAAVGGPGMGVLDRHGITGGTGDPMSFFCPHFDQATEACAKLRCECVPGRPGCVLAGKVQFLKPAAERARRSPPRRRPPAAPPAPDRGSPP